MVCTVEVFPMAPGFPEAVMGYKAGGKHGIYVRICCHHPRGVPAARRWAAPLPISDGICTGCFDRVTREMLGER